MESIRQGPGRVLVRRRQSDLVHPVGDVPGHLGDETPRGEEDVPGVVEVRVPTEEVDPVESLPVRPDLTVDRQELLKRVVEVGVEGQFHEEPFDSQEEVHKEVPLNQLEWVPHRTKRRKQVFPAGSLVMDSVSLLFL